MAKRFPVILLISIISATLFSLNLQAQKEIAVVNLMRFTHVTHHHIGATIFHNSDRRYAIECNLDSIISITIDSLTSIDTRRFNYTFLEIDDMLKRRMSAAGVKKALPMLNIDKDKYDYVLLLNQGVYSTYTTKDWNFVDLGFYTWFDKDPVIYAPIKGYIYSFEKEKGAKFSNPGLVSNNTVYHKEIEMSDRTKNGTIPDETIADIQSEILALLQNQLMHLESGTAMKALKKVDK